jgi:hypothetical protein
MEYMIIIYLLLLAGHGHTTYEQMAYERSYVTTGTVPDAHYVEEDARFPDSYRRRNQKLRMLEESK